MTFRLIASYLYSDWFASGEIPLRAVHEGLIDRFGAIDNSQGGTTQRFNLNGNVLWKPSEDQVVSLQGYASYYSLNLYDNFTFFLVDPENGDGINQSDRRWYGGFDGRYERQDRPFGVNTTSTAGFQYRIDAPRVVLATQADRHRLARTQDAQDPGAVVLPVREVRPGAVPPRPGCASSPAPAATSSPTTSETSSRTGTLDGSAVRGIPSVKANLALGPWYNTEFFANFGTGFHSNDARAVILDPGLDALARAQGYEFGVRVRPHPRVQASATYWALNLASELVFVGDEGTTEPAGASRRQGVEFSTQVQLFDWLTFNGNFTYTQRHLRQRGRGAAGPALDGPGRPDRALALGTQRGPRP